MSWKRGWNHGAARSKRISPDLLWRVKQIGRNFSLDMRCVEIFRANYWLGGPACLENAANRAGSSGGRGWGAMAGLRTVPKANRGGD